MALDLSFPRRPILEMWLGGQWRDLSSDVRQKPGYRIAYGAKDESTAPSPALARFTLDDTAHNYSPHDPRGIYFGQEFQNAPCRLALDVGKDAFARTVAADWGTSPQNGAWSGAGTRSVSGGEGRHSIAGTNTFVRTTLDTINSRDIEVRVSVIIDSVASVTGGALEAANIILRYGNSGADFYLCRMKVTTSNTVELSILSRDTSTIAGPVVLGTAYSGQQWRVAACVERDTIRMKAWPTSTTEQQHWDLTSEPFAAFVSGGVGVRSGVATGNTNAKPIVFRYSNLEIRKPRHIGEVSKWAPARKKGEVDRTVAVEVSALPRRLQQAKNVLRSAAYRYITRPGRPFVPCEYWALDENSDATSLGTNSVLGGDYAKFVQQLDANSLLSGAVSWGAGKGLVGIGQSATLTGVGQLVLPVRTANLATAYSVAWVQKLSQDSGGRVVMRNVTAANDVFFTFFTDGTYQVQIGTGLSFTTVFTGQLPLPGYDDTWHHFSFTMDRITGTQIGCRLSIDGDTVNSALVSPVTYAALRQIELQGGDQGTTNPGAFGQVVVFPQRNLDSGIAGLLYDGVYGQIGETALARFLRVTTEEGYEADYRGITVVSATMGPQPMKTLMQILDECVAVDRGSRYDLKASLALAMRTVNSTLLQPAALTLSYAGGQVDEEFQPTTDDQGLINDVTAKRPNGGAFQAVKATGPKNVLDPGTVAGAVGRVDGSVDTNVTNDSLLPEQAGWRVSKGTVAEPRYPTIAVNLRAPDITNAVAEAALDVGPDDLIQVTNAGSAGVFVPARQIARGYTETFDTAALHSIVFTCSPASLYDAAVLDSATNGVLAGNTSHGAPSTITSGVTTTGVTLSVASTGYLWKTGAQTLQAILNGEQVTVTNVTGTSSPQTFTVVRSVNGVVKTHTSGAPIEVMTPRRLAPS